ncbi:hypothetical protein ACFFSY_28795 [Paenibacillus aurantiacus]|uniref:Lipoprotein n=1 Tax=Paenibacillus aurantiacus TaxID=1936118 RepID=A0ABV5L0G5_9BACL
MGKTRKVLQTALLIGLAAATILAAGCGPQARSAATGNEASGDAKTQAQSSTNEKAAEDAGEEGASDGEQPADPVPSDEGTEVVIPPVTLPERNITLSPEPNGALLQIGEKKQLFDWVYTTPRMILPQEQVTDYDQDGNDELAVVLHVGSGTGVAIDELHIVEFEGVEAKSDDSGDSPFVDHVFTDEDYRAQLENSLAFKTSTEDGELFGYVTLDSTTTKVSLKPFQTGYNGEVTGELGYGAIVRFEAVNNKLTGTFAVGVVIENVVEPQYFGQIKADVGYKDGKFQLEGFQFIADE